MIASIIFIVVSITELGFGQNFCDPETRFQCQDGLCLSRAKVCNSIRDCRNGEDERDCETTSCMNRNLTMAKLNRYYPGRMTACKKQPCTSDDDCRGRKTCVCDDECGRSCLNRDAKCGIPPPIPNMRGYQVYKKQLLVRSRPYYYGSYVKYFCQSGFTLKGPVPRCNGRARWSGERPACVDERRNETFIVVTSCNGRRPEIPHAQYMDSSQLHSSERKVGDVLKYRCDEGYTRKGGQVTCGPDGQWTSFRCVVTCLKTYDYRKEIRLGLTCGRTCETNSDCGRGEFCKCDGPCSRVCVSEDMDCGAAPVIARASVTINGSIARYQCLEGYYLLSGKLSMHCLGSGNIWDNSNAPVCSPVLCGDPSLSIQETRGRLIDERNFYYYGTVVNFACPRHHRLIGSRTRRCMDNGQWSGELPVCNLIDQNQDKCPHPGRPINGRIIGNVIGNIGDIVRFECDEGYIMYGLAEQECLWFREWSGSRTPKCVDYRYPHISSNPFNTLTRLLENLPDVETGVHRSINTNDMDEKHEIYFVFDISETVRRDEDQLNVGIKFAIRLVRRLENFDGNVNYCIILFASDCITLRNVSASDQNADGVVEQLNDILSNVTAEAGSGRATSKALNELRAQIEFKYKLEPFRKKHVFMFVGGMHTEGGRPVDIKKTLESSYENTEFYSITACNNCNKEVIDELKLLSTSEEHNGKNFIKLEDFYKLSHYLDKVTDVNKDYSECGISGNQESVKKLASTIKQISDKGENAEEDSWRWQVLITQRNTSMAQTLSDDGNIIGGGSIINEHWVLTAAHVLNKKSNMYFNAEDFTWMDEIALFVGIVDRPGSGEEVKKSVKAYEMKSYKEHRGFTWDLDNDIALIEVGTRLHNNMSKTNEGEGLTFGYYVRPVCLPCTGTCVKNEDLVDARGVSLINNAMSDEEKCRVEENFLRDHNAMAVVTGFGHVKKEDAQFRGVDMATRLQMELLRIENNETCEDGVTALKQIRQSYRYTDKMICCKSGSTYKRYGACTGDSGGALVRRVEHRAGETNREKHEYCWVAVGIVSFGLGCASGKPGYYTNVARYVQWINMNIDDTGCTEEPTMIENAGRVQVFKNDTQGKPVPIMHAPYPYGSYAKYYCNPLYRLEGPLTKCSIGKEWSEGRPRCVATGEQCSERNVLLLEENRTCKKACTSDAECGRKRCLCDTECGLSCFKIAGDCRQPDNITYGVVTIDHTRWGGIARYSCSEGYRLQGTETRRCNADRKWGGPVPKCIRISCETPNDEPNSFSDARSFILGNYYNFRCPLGFYLVGNRTRLCQLDGSWGKSQHHCNITMCKPLDIANGRIETTYGLKFGSKAIVRCNAGYQNKSPHRVIRCSTDPRGSRYAKWLGNIPSCTKLPCPEPMAPAENGFIRNIEQVTPQYGARIDYQCNPGYRLEGPANATCNARQEWGERPVCIVDLNCDFESFFCGYGANNWERLRSRGDEGYEGALIRSLRESYLESLEVPRGWSDQFVCLKFYYKLSRGGVLELERMDGTVLWTTHVNEEIGKWSNATLTIDATFGLQYRFHANKDDIMIYEITSGTDECDIKCQDPNKIITNGKLEKSPSGLLLPDSTVTYKCNDGYKLSGEITTVLTKTVVCVKQEHQLGSEWIPSISSIICIKKYCDRPTLHPNQIVITAREGKWYIGDIVHIECNVGYEFSFEEETESITCRNDETWSSTPTQCQENIKCEHPDESIIGGKLGNITSAPLLPNSTAVYKCNHGYKIAGGDATISTKTVKCVKKKDELGSEWIPKPSSITCTRIFCVAPEAHPHQYLVKYEQHFPLYAAPYYVGDQASYKCDDGYEFPSSLKTERFMCRDDETWSGTPTPCNENIKCQAPDKNVTNGKLEIISDAPLLPDSTATYKCNEGYKLSGENTALLTVTAKCVKRENQLGSAWIPKISFIICIKKYCTSPTLRENQNFSNPREGKWFIGDIANIRCDTGYEFPFEEETESITCRNDETWSSTPTQCQERKLL